MLAKPAPSSSKTAIADDRSDGTARFIESFHGRCVFLPFPRELSCLSILTSACHAYSTPNQKDVWIFNVANMCTCV